MSDDIHFHAVGGRRFWALDPTVTFLNHGSFRACPRPVLKRQQEIRTRLERQPVKFFVDDFEGLWDEARRALARFVGARSGDLVFVQNATSGVNTVLRSLKFKRGDELLVTDHEYNACRNALEFAAERWAARPVVVSLPFPVASPDMIIEAILRRVTRRTRLALIDHVTSQTGLVLPIARLARELEGRGVDLLVDGAHAPGMVDLNLSRLGAAYYTGNCHKWLCAPKGAAFLHVRNDRQKVIRPLTISHGANSKRTDRSRFLLETGWTGTTDPSAWLCVPEALRVMTSLLPGGWPQMMQRNRELALAGRKVLCAALAISAPCPDAMIGSMAALPVPDLSRREVATLARVPDPLRLLLLNDFGIEVPTIPWPAPPQRLLRISAQLYNSLPQYQHLAHALKKIFKQACIET